MGHIKWKNLSRAIILNPIRRNLWFPINYNSLNAHNNFVIQSGIIDEDSNKNVSIQVFTLKLVQ